MSTRTVDLLLLPIVLLATALSMVIAVAGANSPLLGRVAGLGLIWTTLGVTISARGLQGPAVAARGNPFRRAGIVVGKWCGWTGIATAATIIVVLAVTAPNTWMSRWVYVTIAVGACVLLGMKGPVRRVATGVLIACASQAWPYLLVIGFALIPVLLVTLLTAAVCARVERRRRLVRDE
jgi:hypothetical protein